nr:hypothetical protein [Tanacetum cinerariifolium]
MAISSSSLSADNGVPSCSGSCSKAYEQLHSQYDKLTVDFRKSQFDVLSYQAALESVEARLVLYKQNESIFQDNIIMLKNKLSTAKPTQDLTHTNIPSVPIIKEWVSDSEDKSETTAPQIAPSFVQTSEHVKPSGHSAQPVETSIPAATPKPTSPKSNKSGKRRNRKTCFVCRSVDHLIKDLLTQSKPIFNTAVRPVSVSVPKILVTRPRHAHSPVTKYKSPIRRHITRSPSLKTSNSLLKVTAVKTPVVSAATDYELAAGLRAEEQR